MRSFSVLVIVLFLSTVCTPTLASDPPSREYSLDVWDWTTPCRDLATFRTWAEDLKQVGVTRIEISTPWRELEPEPGKYNLSYIADRFAIAKSHGLGLRVRINSFYNGATPGWLKADLWRDADGNPPAGTPNPPSINDPRFWASYAPLCTAIAARFKGEDVLYNAFIGVHAELKYADWWTYDPASLALWRETIRSRPAWLLDIVGDAPLPDVPPVPQDTNGTPDNTPASKAFIAFREQNWRDAMIRFNAAIKAGDPQARTSAPLGESFRRESAKFSNLDYFGLSRGASQVVHSYDFYWHPKDDAWMAAASVAAFQGITGLPVAFEFDGPALTEHLKYTEPQLVELADAALAQGAGIKLANFSYDPRLPSAWPMVGRYAERIASATPRPAEPREKTVLLFVSKWANYCYREKSEWLHDAQFGAWHMLTSRGFPVRIICEDNLDEDFTGYRAMYVAFSPYELMPTSARRKLERFEQQIPMIIEPKAAPERRPETNRFQATITQAGGHLVLFSEPVAYHWLRSDARERYNQRVDDALKRIGLPTEGKQ
jgi:hypothetical protein